MSNWNQSFGVETVIVRNEETGIEARRPVYGQPDAPFTRDYVRVVVTGARAENAVTGEILEGECELVYWDEAEWQEPQGDVMGAIMAAIGRVVNGHEFAVEFGYKAFE